MEGLSANRIGAVLIRDHEGRPAGVVSKTDLILAYRHGMSTEAEARQIMKALSTGWIMKTAWKTPCNN